MYPALYKLRSLGSFAFAMECLPCHRTAWPGLRADLNSTGALRQSVKRTPRSPLRDILARNLRLHRAKRGWSQERLVHESGLNRTCLSAVERAEQNISVDNIARLATAPQVEAWTLLQEQV